MERARQRLKQETDVVQLIKANRFFHEAIQKLLPKEKLQEIKRQVEYINYD